MSIEVVASSLLTAVAGNTAALLYEAVLKFVNSRRDGTTAVDKSIRSITDASAIGSLTREIEEAEIQSGYNSVASGTMDAISIVANMNRVLREDRRRQANWSFAVAIASLIIGAIVLFVGVALLIAGLVTEGAVAAGAGLITEIVSGVAFKYHKDTNDRLDTVIADGAILEAAQIGIDTARRIEDPSLRDLTLSELATKIQNMRNR